jgi:hypothetical protein
MIAYPSGTPPGACGLPGPLLLAQPLSVFLDFNTGCAEVATGTYALLADGTNPSRLSDAGPVAGLTLEGALLPTGALTAVSGSATLTQVCGTVTGSFDAVFAGDAGSLSGSFAAPFCPSGE